MNEIINGLNLSALPHPWKNGIITVEMNYGSTTKKRTVNFVTHVGWDKSFGSRDGQYVVIVSSPIVDPVFTALDMAALMKRYN